MCANVSFMSNKAISTMFTLVTHTMKRDNIVNNREKA